MHLRAAPGGEAVFERDSLHRPGEVDFLKQISANCCQVQPLSADRRIRLRSMTKPSNCGGGGGEGGAGSSTKLRAGGKLAEKARG
jgi:hypothetical protein